MARELDWENLRLFAVLHRHGSFTSAARSIDLDATTLSRRLTQLEEQLGVLLFQRTTTGLVPTEAAAKLIEHALVVERQIQLAREDATGRAAEVAGVVRVALTDQTAISLLLPRVSVLRKRHPGVELELVVGDSFVDLARGDADIAVRFQYPGRGAPADPASSVELTARRVGAMYVGVYASRSYLDKRGRPANAFDVEGHDLVLTRRDEVPLPGAPWVAATRGRGRAVIRTDGLGSMHAAVVAGLGIGALPLIVAGANRELVQLGPPAVVDEREIWLVVPTDLARVARVRAVWDFLVETAELYRAENSAGSPPPKEGSRSTGASPVARSSARPNAARRGRTPRKRAT